MRQFFSEKQKKLAAFLLTAVMLVSVCNPSSFAASVENAQVMAAALSDTTIKADGMVRVYLSSLGTVTSLDLTVNGNYSLSTTGEFLSSGSRLTVGFNTATGEIRLTRNGQTTSMGKSFSLRRHSASGTNGILIAQSREPNNPYPGDLSFEAVSSGSGYKLYTIAHIYIENYLYGVLPYEMGNSTSLEALKAQAVAARTYTVRMMNSRSSGRYDVVDTTSDQVYRGTPSGNANCVAAVDATKGIVLMYGSSYITTYYSASNGGQTETNRSGTAYAYMKVKDDPFDYANPSSTVKQKTVYADLTSASNNASLIQLLKSKAASKLQQLGYAATLYNTTPKTLKSITPHTPKYATPSRLYTKMDFTFTVSTQNTSGQTVSVTQTVTCDIFDELESMLSMGIQSSDNELWSVQKSGGNFVLQARRYGHGMGMSQRGAMYMAKLGYTYDEILGFYYDGCKRVRHSFTHTILSASSADKEVTEDTPADLGEQDSYACKGTVTLAGNSASLAIRNAASNTAAIIGTAGNGAIVQVLSSEGGWCLIRFGEICGYAPASALSISGTPDGSSATVTQIAGFATVTANDFVNLRASGSMNAQVLGTAPTGAVLTVFSVNGSWAKVQYNALVAYANTGYISNVVSSYLSGNVSSGQQTAVVSTQEAIPLRQTPSMLAQVSATLAAGTAVTVLSDDGSWCQVSCMGMMGYVLKEQISYSDDVQAPEGDGEGILPPENDEGSSDSTQTPALMQAVVTTEYGSLNMRAEAKAGSRILTTIPRSMTIDVLEHGQTWCLVRYGGWTGYVMTCYLTLLGGGQTQPQPDASGATAVVVTPGGSLNLRSQPRSGSEILTRIPEYATVTVHEKGGEWCRVSYGPYTGYVMTVFLSFAETVPPPAQEETPPPQEEEQPEEEETPETAPDSSVLRAVVSTVSGSLNLRMNALPGSPVLCRIPKGTTIVVEEKLAAWSRTSYGGYTGYVSNTYLTFINNLPQTSTGETAVVTTPSGSLNLRSAPSRDAGVIGSIPPYATVQIHQRGAEWCEVSYLGQSGYVMTSFLTFSSVPPTQESEPENEGDASTPAQTETQTAYVNTVSGSLNLRAQPGSGYRVLTTIPQYAPVQVLTYGADWCVVRYEGWEGYVMTSFLAFAKQPQTSTETQPENAGGQEDATVETKPNNGFTAVDAWVSTQSGSLHLRLAPDANAESLASIPQYAQVQLLEKGVEWSYIAYQGRYGYAMTGYLTEGVYTPPASEPTQPENQQPSEDSPTGVVNTGGVKLDVTLERPDHAIFAVNAAQQPTELWLMCEAQGEPLAVVPAGEQMEIILQGQDWCCVAYQNVQGYCETKLLSVVQ